ncbi:MULTISPECIES: helix-turn-helix domain-containing protein [Streptomyces]|uniref:Helix-turn-helix domain-containing protein n=1 Tax=Streptomyces spinosisporus TaxID=2927582 RepID=A0ABS9XWP4_9ACTN|nr:MULTISPECIES: helix-turn-helix domain-containing protein [Streptomyces]MCI3246510.1 helix-turn-helix domain-containing protein [Streptomyces spinosisporus]WUB33427.1 helix-turn-helix domain-containing protein [Streptomyces sp. NBC_00588]WUB41342.1 helix-turn-helix domain-containing protein [Streptomyces sp. NBC_00588]
MTDSKASRLRGTESFEAVASALFAPLRVTDPGPQGFEAVVDHAVIGPVVVARIQATAATVTRDNHSITSSDVEWMHFNLHHRGPVTATQDDRTATVKPGELFACDNTRPYRLIGAAPSDMTVLCVPRASLGRYANSISRRTVFPIPTQDAIGGLLGHTLSAVNDGLPRHGVARTHLADALTALLLAAFADTTPERASVASDLVDRIRAYALAHLGDSHLGAERVARQHRISVRHLHALFKGGDLTFVAWVRHERLLRIRRDLLDPASADISTATIAARWGIHDTKHLGRALKREFGETVNDLRRRRMH